MHAPTTSTDLPATPGPGAATGPVERRLVTADELVALRAAIDSPTAGDPVTDPTS